MKQLPVADIHCDLLSYLHAVKGADAFKRDDIGCNIGALNEGNVKLQVMAVYTSTEAGSAESGMEQSILYKNLPVTYPENFHFIKEGNSTPVLTAGTTIIAAIENASSFCDENMLLENGLQKLEEIIRITGGIMYIGMTHHGENRFGGGNSTAIGLKEDGKTLLEFLSGKRIAVDLSHTSDALAFGILDHIEKHDLKVPVIASHSNFRKVFNHPRNLPDDIAKEIIKRKGIIGMNFLRAFLNNDDPEALFKHIQYGLQLGGAEALCFGADYFYTASHPDQTRKPFYHLNQDNAACYPGILGKISAGNRITAENIGYENVIKFLHRHIL